LIMRTLDTLQEMLMWRRPGGSKSERKFIAKYIEPLGVNKDLQGNLIKRIGDAPVLWSCHTDTVHNQGGIQPVERAGDVMALPSRKVSNCLGADDTAGVWLMCNMIAAKVAGLYVFHREEESGAQGSRFISKRTPSLLKDIRYAIALDRKGKRDVITHQFGRCCSDAFATSLAEALNVGGLDYTADSTGIFTDTANYTDLVGECTNLSVGYYGQHSKQEIQDGAHCAALLEALIKLPTKDLIVARKPGEDDPSDWGSWADDWKDYVHGNGYVHGMSTTATSTTSGVYGRAYGSNTQPYTGDWSSHLDDDRENARVWDLYSIVREYPEETADFLEQYGVDATELWNHVASSRK
jgi:hypothetical protein